MNVADYGLRLFASREAYSEMRCPTSTISTYLPIDIHERLARECKAEVLGKIEPYKPCVTIPSTCKIPIATIIASILDISYGRFDKLLHLTTRCAL